jgi:hypothetical protein
MPSTTSVTVVVAKPISARCGLRSPRKPRAKQNSAQTMWLGPVSHMLAVTQPANDRSPILS